VEATQQYEETRKKVAAFIGAASPEEIVFTKNCTEAINCIRFSWGEKNINHGDEIIVSGLEHHANFVPWQTLAAEKGAILKIIPVTSDFQLDLEAYKKMLSKKTKLVCITSQSNVTGTINPTQEMAQLAHAKGAFVMVDGAQSVGHRPINVRGIDCDFLAFSAHKMLGPTGVGIIYIKQEIMADMPPFMYGGEMVETVQDTHTTYRTGPWKFEAGTPNIADIIAFSASLDYLKKTGITRIAKHDNQLIVQAKKNVAQISKSAYILSY
jgi:cysteine desulfurase/selenocysteine lyase